MEYCIAKLNQYRLFLFLTNLLLVWCMFYDTTTQFFDIFGSVRTWGVIVARVSGNFGSNTNDFFVPRKMGFQFSHAKTRLTHSELSPAFPKTQTERVPADTLSLSINVAETKMIF